MLRLSGPKPTASSATVHDFLVQEVSWHYSLSGLWAFVAMIVCTITFIITILLGGTPGWRLR